MDGDINYQKDKSCIVINYQNSRRKKCVSSNTNIVTSKFDRLEYRIICQTENTHKTNVGKVKRK